MTSQEHAQTLSDNFYWLAKRDEDNQALNRLECAKLIGSAKGFAFPRARVAPESSVQQGRNMRHLWTA